MWTRSLAFHYKGSLTWGLIFKCIPLRLRLNANNIHGDSSRGSRTRLHERDAAKPAEDGEQSFTSFLPGLHPENCFRPNYRKWTVLNQNMPFKHTAFFHQSYFALLFKKISPKKISSRLKFKTTINLSASMHEAPLFPSLDSILEETF